MENSHSQDLCTDAHPEKKSQRLEILAPIPTHLDQNDLYYSMKKGSGLAIIISHADFDEIDGCVPETRHGTEKDVDGLSSTFSDLGFQIDSVINKTYEEIMDHISEVSRRDDLKDYDCLVVFVLTHGDEGEIICAKDVKYYVKELVEPFTGRNCIQLANKPKLFFIQACKGTVLQRGIQLRTLTDSGLVRPSSKTCVIYSIPEISDVLVAYATIEGCSALRDPSKGSPYITSLCEELRSRGTEENLLNILIRVHKSLSTAVYRVAETVYSVKVQASFLCYLNRFVRFDAPTSRPQTQ